MSLYLVSAALLVAALTAIFFGLLALLEHLLEWISQRSRRRRH